MESYSWILVFLGLGAVAAELVVGVETGFDLVLLGASLIVGGAVGVVSGSFELGLIVTTILAGLYIILGRAFVKKKLFVTSSKTNADEVLGREGLVVKEITEGGVGQVKVGTEIWRAELGDGTIDTLQKGDKIKVEGVSGVTLKVTKWN